MLKQIFAHVDEYKKESFRAITTVFFEVMLEMTVPFLMALVIDRGVATGERQNILVFGGLIILAAFSALVLGIRSGRNSALASAGFAKNLRRAMFHKVQDFSHENLDDFSRASLVSRLTTDVSTVQMMFQGPFLRILVRSPLLVLISFIIVATMNWQLALIFFLVVPPLGFILFLIIKRAQIFFHKLFQHYDRINNIVSENLSAVRVIKANSMERSEIKKFTIANDDLYQDLVRAESLTAINPPIFQFGMYTCILAISFIGAQLVVRGDMLTGELMSVLTYAMQMMMGVVMTAFGFTMYANARPAISRILEVIDEEINLKSPKDPVTTVSNGTISFENVSFSYNTDARLALENINLEIPSGTTVGIIGASGASKTTLISLVSRLYDVTEGRVIVGGHDVRDYDLKTLRRSVSVVLQKNVLFSGSIADNLRFGKDDATEEDFIRVCTVAGAMEFIELLPERFNTRIDELGTNLSGGQKQRLCIARAILAEPKVLILDDSTSAVDVKTESEIFTSFNEFNNDTTVIVISARVASIKNMDMIIVVDDHQIDAVGTHNELLETSAIYRQIYDMQQEMEVDANHEERGLE